MIGLSVTLLVMAIAPKKRLTSEEKDAELLSKTHRTRILVYGDAIEFNKELYVERIVSITPESIGFDSSFEFEYIVLNDRNGQLCMTEKEWNILKELMQSNKHVSFIYLGSTQHKNMIKTKIVDLDEADLFSEPTAIGGINMDGVLYTEVGNAMTPFEIIHNFASAVRHSR